MRRARSAAPPPADWVDLKEADRHLRTGKGRGVRIAIIDSGIDVTNPALASLRLRHDLAVEDDGGLLRAQPGGGRDVNGHGTALAWIIRQLAPEAEIGSFRVLDQYLNAHTGVVHETAMLAISLGYHILNCSFGCGMAEKLGRYKSWVDKAYVEGVHVVAACNNQEFTRPEWPGHFPSVITVDFAAGAKSKEIYFRSGSLVEFVALGHADLPGRDGEPRRMVGSSFAVPRVSALLARLLGGVGLLPPLLAKSVLRRLATPWTPELGTGRPTG